MLQRIMISSTELWYYWVQFSSPAQHQISLTGCFPAILSMMNGPGLKRPWTLARLPRGDCRRLLSNSEL